MDIDKFIEDNLDEILDNPTLFINSEQEKEIKKKVIKSHDIIDNTNEDECLDEIIDYQDLYELGEKNKKNKEEDYIEDTDYYVKLLNIYIKYYNEKFNKKDNLFSNIKNQDKDTNSALELFFEAIIEFKDLKEKLNLDEIDLLNKYYKEDDNEIMNLMNTYEQVYCLEVNEDKENRKIITISLIICLNYIIINKLDNWNIFMLKSY